MKFTPKLADGDVNISKSHPLKEAAWLVGGLVLLMLMLYFSLGFLSGLIAMRLPVKAEIWIGSKISSVFEYDSNDYLQNHLDLLVKALPADSSLHAYNFKIYLDESEQVNAMALPGGSIVVLKGLLKNIKSENELDMVLAHELGHFAHRDHLQAMGRGLLVVAASLLLPGDQSSDIVPWIAGKLERTYSQKQEAAADSWGIDLLNSRYGHVGGATDFFTRLAGKDKSHLSYFFATHPHPDYRIENLNKLILQNHYVVGETIPLPNKKIIFKKPDEVRKQ
ncbi:MAG TPA: peptidase M48 [Desulfobacterales bacterium]|nr:peptidase M48 [Desulfobacterales bacterium]HIP40019.1 peptidase M48 [Desulfocapsa sulfexigens]